LVRTGVCNYLIDLLLKLAITCSCVLLVQYCCMSLEICCLGGSIALRPVVVAVCLDIIEEVRSPMQRDVENTDHTITYIVHAAATSWVSL
jgi:hypothetical protein